MGARGNDVARDTDFLDLYKGLGLEPDCDLQEFRQAYRRRLSILHPDRPVDGAATPPEQLQRLTALYGAAMEFHRQHGRLPGAMHVRSFQPAAARVEAIAPVSPAPNRRTRWWLLLPLAALVVWMAWPAESPAPRTADGDTVSDTSDEDPQTTATTSAAVLAIGMTPVQVRAIEGEPVIIGDDRWDYGPSWVRFEQHKLAGWYSSPLHPLKVAGPTKQP